MLSGNEKASPQGPGRGASQRESELHSSVERGEVVAARLSTARVGTWQLVFPENIVHLDEVCQEMFSLPEAVTHLRFLESVPVADHPTIFGVFGSAEGSILTTAEFRYQKGDEELRIHLRAEARPDGATGIMYVSTENQRRSSLRRRLDEFSEALSSALTPDEVARVLQHTGKELLGAQFTGLAEVTPDGSRLRFIDTEALPLPVKQRWSSFPISATGPTAQVFNERISHVYPSREKLEHFFPDLKEDLEELHLESWAGAPLIVSNETIGVLSVYWGREQEFSTEDIEFLYALAGISAQALGRSRLFERQQDATHTLQRAVLPENLPKVPGVEIAARYLPTEEGPGMGGDWYDGFHLPSGEVYLVAGDVTGRGEGAAALMGQLRNALRAYALEGHGPAGVVERLHLLVETMYPGSYATVLIVALDPVDGSFTWVNAGHPPLLLTDEQEVRQLGENPDPMLGAVPGYSYTTRQGRLPEGGMLVLYSDGLVEDRDQSIEMGLERFSSSLLSRRHTTLEVSCSHLLEELVENRVRTDDLCLLLARRPGRDEERAELALPNNLQSPGRARQFVSEKLSEWNVLHLEDTALLLVSEVVTNAVVHARSNPNLVLALDGVALTVSVHDTSPKAPVRRKVSLSATSGRGMALVDSMSDRWGVDETTGGKDVWFELRRDRPEVFALDAELLAEIAELTS